MALGLRKLDSKRTLPATLLVLAILALAVPGRWHSWASGFSRLTETLARPVTAPIAKVSRWIAPAGPRIPNDDGIRILEEQRDSLEAIVLNLRMENDRLRRMLEDQKVFIAVNNESVIQQSAPVIGSGTDLLSGLLTIRAGSKEGVTENAVVTASGLQLLGRVQELTERTCRVMPITAANAQPIDASIILDLNAEKLTCRLKPQGDGTLKGAIEDKRDSNNAALVPPIGATVRLNDSRWPRNAQMLIVGKVVAIEPSPNQQLRQIVTVRPIVENLDRVSEVVLRLPPAGGIR